MTALSKLFVVVIGLALLTGCNFFGSSTEVETTEVDTLEFGESLNAEVNNLTEEEVAIEEALDALEAEEF